MIPAERILLGGLTVAVAWLLYQEHVADIDYANDRAAWYRALDLWAAGA